MLSRGQTKRRRKKPLFPPFKAFSADSTPECDGCDLEVLALETEVTVSCSGFSSSGEPLDFYFSFSSGQTGGEELYLGEVEGDDEAELTTRWVNNLPLYTVWVVGVYGLQGSLRDFFGGIHLK